MAQLKQCANGHYYDPGMHPSCPYCSGASTGIDRSVSGYDIKTTYPSGGFPGTSPVGGETVSPDGFIGTVDVSVSNGSAGETLPPSRPVIDDSDQHTTIVGQGSRRKKESPAQNTSRNEDEGDALPERYVVGWLVAVEGPYIGQSFELHQSYNHIGREKGDIVLSKDRSVSSEKNVSILYTKYNQFMIGAGQSTNEVYLNKNVLFAGSGHELKAYDEIELGMSRFRFVPFCGPEFRWLDTEA